MKSSRVTIDESLCQGHARCWTLAPTVFGLREDDGHAFVLDVELSPDDLLAAKKAQEGCPERAIVVIDSD